MIFSRMSMGIKVAELNTLSDGKGITGIRFFNEMENTNESTNLRKLADVWMSKNRCCQGNRNRSAVGVTRITVHIVGHPNQVNSHRFRSPKLPQNVRFHQTPRSKTIEVEFQIRVGQSGVHCCHAAVKKCQNSRKWSNKLVESITIQFEIRKRTRQTCSEIICGRRRQRHRFMCAVK